MYIVHEIIIIIIIYIYNNIIKLQKNFEKFREIFINTYRFMKIVLNFIFFIIIHEIKFTAKCIIFIKIKKIVLNF